MEKLFKFLQEELTKRRLNYTIEDELVTVLIGENAIHFQIEDEENYQACMIFDYDPTYNWNGSQIDLCTDEDYICGSSELENFKEFIYASIERANKYIKLKVKVDAMIQKIKDTIEESDLEISANEDINFETFVSCY